MIESTGDIIITTKIEPNNIDVNNEELINPFNLNDPSLNEEEDDKALNKKRPRGRSPSIKKSPKTKKQKV
jgi:hypothetical protein